MTKPNTRIASQDMGWLLFLDGLARNHKALMAYGMKHMAKASASQEQGDE